MKIKSLMFFEGFCTKNESFSFNIHEILVPQILCIFLQKICGFMTFGMDFDFNVILMGRMMLGMWKGWCNLFSINFVHNNSMFSMLYIRIFEKSQFYRISCVGSLTSLINTCWLSVDQMLIFEKYDVWGTFWIFIFMSYLQPLWKYSHFFFKNYLISQFTGGFSLYMYSISRFYHLSARIFFSVFSL